jgi:hypothetical protein
VGQRAEFEFSGAARITTGEGTLEASALYWNQRELTGIARKL